MVKSVYTFLYYLMSPLMCIRWFFKSLKPPKYREPFRQRFGFVANHAETDIWFHAVSVGESQGAVSIIKRLLSESPEIKIVVTTTTPTGAKVILDALDGKVVHYYSPCDLPGSIRRFIRRVNPNLVVIMETELWPNWIEHISQKQIPLILANARLSKSSLGKYLTFPKASKAIFSKISKILAVSQADASRFIEAGSIEDSVQGIGNIKFDADFDEDVNDDFYPYWNEDFIWIAASTHLGEDEVILKAHSALLKLNPSAKLIIVPRHPERFDSVANLITDMEFKMARRSNGQSWGQDAQVLLGDTMGELLLAYQKSKVAFIAGSFVNIGGHNAIEAAYFSKPILTGPVYHNFQYLFDALIEEKGAEVVADSKELAKYLFFLAENPKQAQLMGANAKKVIEHNKGALNKVVTEIQNTLKG